ncbi:TRAP-type C4-dicarboxylate transport system permease small subunit [Sinorhizobium kostiense]|uniref:TRAP transporter small permease protein n=1 Tax=Sinorhizobium kostiense TaxID=76747 RepID=A0ABS4R7D8_9HYPH|nr:TRAP transporter small permease [Sinorhizobium kostiense]MBP2238245.1 TRAP-type C4-dicarboxylate transport system permease small subunit [Sinorhizobium kostiense]
MANRSRWRSLAHLEETLAAILLVFAFVVIALQIATRFILRDPLFWTEEAARYAFVWLVALGAAAGLTSRTHITMDIVPMMLPERAQLILRLVLDLLVLGALLILVYYGSFGAMRAHKVMSIAIGVPESWLYGALPVFGLLAAVRIMLVMARDARTLLSGRRPIVDTPSERFL